MVKNLGSIKDDFLRTLLWGALWDSVRESELDPAVFLDLGLRLVTAEKDEVAVQSLLGRMSTAFNRYISDSESKRAVGPFEELLSGQMQQADSVGRRITYFRAFQSVATTERARKTLKQLLTGELSIPGMTIRPRDRFDMITALLTSSDPEAPNLLNAAKEGAPVTSWTSLESTEPTYSLPFPVNRKWLPSDRKSG